MVTNVIITDGSTTLRLLGPDLNNTEQYITGQIRIQDQNYKASYWADIIKLRLVFNKIDIVTVTKETVDYDSLANVATKLNTFLGKELTLTLNLDTTPRAYTGIIINPNNAIITNQDCSNNFILEFEGTEVVA